MSLFCVSLLRYPTTSQNFAVLSASLFCTSRICRRRMSVRCFALLLCFFSFAIVFARLFAVSPTVSPRDLSSSSNSHFAQAILEQGNGQARKVREILVSPSPFPSSSPFPFYPHLQRFFLDLDSHDVTVLLRFLCSNIEELNNNSVHLRTKFIR